jgi:uncharacterized protein
MTSASPIEPSERIGTIDILRGLALLIVLIINAATEFRVSIFDQLLPAPAPNAAAYPISDAIILALHTKGFILFSFLFGVGLAIQFDRLAANDQRLALMLRRLAILLAIGLAHLFLIWNGDILTEYAIAGFAVLPFLYGPRRLLAAACAVSLAFYLASPLLPPIWELPERTWILQHVEKARRVYGSGSFMEILAFRMDEVRHILPLHVQALPRTFGLFLLGILAWQSGFFRKPPASKPLTLAACFALAAGAWLTITGANAEAFGAWLKWPGQHVVQSLAQLVLAAGYAGMVIVAAENSLGRKLLRPAGALGRMAFTNYLAQSVILSWIFYGYGLALFGRSTVLETLAICLAIYIAQAGVSMWWLGRFGFGPVEWLWRSLMYGELQRASLGSAPASN